MMHNSKEYVEKGGQVCPNCDSDFIEGGEVNIDCAQAHQDVSCNECGAEWIDVYNLGEYVELSVPA